MIVFHVTDFTTTYSNAVVGLALVLGVLGLLTFATTKSNKVCTLIHRSHVSNSRCFGLGRYSIHGTEVAGMVLCGCVWDNARIFARRES
jgi:hypothetical protein